MTASDVLIQPVTISGIIAFRYLAPGVLGLLGEITPASPAKAAFRVADEWPLQGKTFLVDGWLGADGLTGSCALSPTAGDALLPDARRLPLRQLDERRGDGLAQRLTRAAAEASRGGRRHAPDRFDRSRRAGPRHLRRP